MERIKIFRNQPFVLIDDDFGEMMNWAVRYALGRRTYAVDELTRVSKRQVIWGGNYFTDVLPPSKSFIVWDKRCDDAMRNNFADCEYAWLSEGMGVARVCRYLWKGMLQGDMRNKEERFHPTQKHPQGWKNLKRKRAWIFIGCCRDS